MKLKSKAKTLKDLKLRHSRIPILKIFKCEDFINNRKRILNNISGTFKNHNVAIRSSLLLKDVDAPLRHIPHFIDNDQEL